MTNYVYVLGLEGGKYYIGKTNNVCARLDEHSNGEGSEWTRNYPMTNVQEIIENGDEDSVTISYMNKFGADNVRGGSFCTMKLKDSEREVINKMIKTKSDACYTCGSHNHLMNSCHRSSGVVCYTCGTPGHTSTTCYKNHYYPRKYTSYKSKPSQKSSYKKTEKSKSSSKTKSKSKRSKPKTSQSKSKKYY